jgi:hypothetical protein
MTMLAILIVLNSRRAENSIYPQDAFYKPISCSGTKPGFTLTSVATSADSCFTGTALRTMDRGAATILRPAVPVMLGWRAVQSLLPGRQLRPSRLPRNWIAVTPAFDLSRRLDNGLQEVLHVAHEALLGLGLTVQLITAQ